MAFYIKKEDFYPLIEHHIALMERLNEEIEFSIICFKIALNNKEIKELIRKTFRKTDIITNVKNYYFAFLPLTDYNGAFNLLSGINEFLGEENKEIIVSFGEDGNNGYQLLKKLSELIEEKLGVHIEFF